MERILSITSKISEGLASALGRSPQARSNARMQDPGTTVATDVHGNVARIPKNSVSKVLVRFVLLPTSARLSVCITTSLCRTSMGMEISI